MHTPSNLPTSQQIPCSRISRISRSIPLASALFVATAATFAQTPNTTPAELPAIAEHVVMTERRSMAAERDAMDRYIAAFLEDRVGATFSGRIIKSPPCPAI